MRWIVPVVGILVAIGMIAVAIRPAAPQLSGTIAIEAFAKQQISAVRGTPVVAEFRLRNDTNRSISIDGVRTGCGCAVLTAGDDNLLGQVISPHSTLPTSLKVDTTSRAMGDFSLPIEIFASDDLGRRYHLSSAQNIRVNPGWGTSKQRLTLQSKSSGTAEVVDDFMLLQTSTDHPFEITSAAIRHDHVQVDFQEVGPNEIQEDLVVSKGNLRWKAIPRYRVRVSVLANAIKKRETAQLVIELSHKLTRVVLDVEILPPRQPLSVSPNELILDQQGTSSKRDFVVSVQGSIESLRITPPLGVAIINRVAIGTNLLKVNVIVDHNSWNGETILVRDDLGNSQQLLIARDR